MDSVAAIRAGLKTREFTAAQVVRTHLDKIEELDSDVKALLRVDREGAQKAARAVDAAQLRGQDLGPLMGVPVILKDNMVTRGLETTAGSRILQGWVPPYEGHVADRVRSAGGIVLGKANMDEFAMGSSTERSAFGPTRNPRDLERIPGGSSGGSAAAVAAQMCCVAFGSDTGGSIRQPAGLCGVVGLKPTWGRVSRYGLIAYASSLDQIGPLGRTVRDVALGLGAIAGHDPRDSTSVDRPVPDYLEPLEEPLEGLRVGLPAAYFGEGLDPEIEAAVRGAVSRLERQGARVVEVELPSTRHSLAAYYVIAPAEASSNLARFDGVRYGLRVYGHDLLDMYRTTRGDGFGAEVKRRIMLGTYALSAGYYDAYYGTAQRVRTLIRRGFEAAFERCDVIACPTSPITAPRLGEKVDDPMAMYLMDVYTISANLAGIPAISLPCGEASDGLPIGFQLMGRAWQEATLLQVAAAHERANG